jgi:hypothetical protein
MKKCFYKIAADFSRSTENVSADEGKGRFAQVNCLIRINFFDFGPIILYVLYMYCFPDPLFYWSYCKLFLLYQNQKLVSM